MWPCKALALLFQLLNVYLQKILHQGSPKQSLQQSCPMITSDLSHQMALITQGQSADYMIDNKYLYWPSEVNTKPMRLPCLRAGLRRHCVYTEPGLHWHLQCVCHFDKGLLFPRKIYRPIFFIWIWNRESQAKSRVCCLEKECKEEIISGKWAKWMSGSDLWPLPHPPHTERWGQITSLFVEITVWKGTIF